VARLRHLAIATDDPDRTAQFYVDTFAMTRVRSARGAWGYGHILSDGHLNLAILRFVTDEAAGVEKGTGFRGLHHIGFEVDDVDGAAERVAAAGCRARTDIDEALGIPHDGPIKGEFKFEGPDGVVFDLSQPGVWQLEPR
jgi:glyoxylase I family protein